jgi:hypothetical protein
MQRLVGNLEFVGGAMDVTTAKQATAALEKAFKEIEILKDQLYKEKIASWPHLGNES